MFALAFVLLIPVTPAGAASVVITPASTTGFVHADNTGGALVDVTVCATFDQPVAFIEAIVQFSGPMGGVAIDGPRGGKVTSWCGTAPDLSAGPPGTEVIDVSWAANNGNGLSEGHAHSSGMFTVPGPPPSPKKTPQQAASLGHASNAMWKAAAIIAVGGVVIGLSGGTLAPAVLGILGGGVAAYMAADLSDLSIDPPDPNYMVRVVAHNRSLPRYAPREGISVGAANALNALHRAQEDETGQADAMVAALYKAEGAAAAGNAAWERSQTLATAMFARNLTIDLSAEVHLRTKARSELAAGGFPVFAVTAAEAGSGQDTWDSAGLTPAQRDSLTLGGTKPLDERLHAIVRASDATEFAQSNVLDLLAPSGAGTAAVRTHAVAGTTQQPLNAVERANAEAISALKSWADTLEPTASLNIPRQKASVTRRGALAVRLTCAGTPCSGTLQLSARVAGGKKRKPRNVEIARSGFTKISIGTHAVALRLNSTGLRLLRQAAYRLGSTATVRYASGSRRRTAIGRVSLQGAR